MAAPARTPAEQAVAEKRRTIELTLASLRRERAAATHPQHRRMLDEAIAALEAQHQALT